MRAGSGADEWINGLMRSPESTVWNILIRELRKFTRMFFLAILNLRLSESGKIFNREICEIREPRKLSGESEFNHR